jgi:cold shock CspA family protein
VSSSFSIAAGRRPAAPARLAAARPADPQGLVATGRIVRLLVGQGHGYIRMAGGREIFFHRADVRDGTSFNEFVVGDSVTFEVLEDAVSGARALRVRSRERDR